MNKALHVLSYVFVFAFAFALRGFLDADPAPAQGLATSPAPAERIAPNNVVASREPVKEAVPAVPAPAGAAITGTAVATFRPRPLLQPAGSSANQFANLRKLPDAKYATGGDAHISPDAPLCSCDDIQLAVTTFKDETGERWQFYSPNADIVEATHKPVLGQMMGAPYKSALGVSWRPEQGGQNIFGVLYQRDVLARLRLGAKVEYEKEKGLQGELQALVPF